MASDDEKIAETLAKYGEPFEGNVWRVQNNAVIYHKVLERIAALAKIHFEPPSILRAERDEAVIMVVGHMEGRSEWSIGEALVGVNYRVTGRMAAYVYAMAEKRAKDRVILKLIELHGLVYSEEEADDFRRPEPLEEHPPKPTASPFLDTGKTTYDDDANVLDDIVGMGPTAPGMSDLAQRLLTIEPLGSNEFKWCFEQIKSKKTAKALEDWNKDSYTQKIKAKMKDADEEEFERAKAYYLQRLTELRPGRKGKDRHDKNGKSRVAGADRASAHRGTA